MAEQAQQANQATTVAAEDNLLESILKTTKPVDDSAKERNAGFIKAVIQSALEAKPGSIVAGDVERTIQAWKAQIDQKLSSQLNEILHHPDFQKLEGTWRGLKYLIDQSETGTQLKIKVLNVQKRTLAKDLERAIEFDQSMLFKHVYENEYGQLGGKPFGAL